MQLRSSMKNRVASTSVDFDNLAIADPQNYYSVLSLKCIWLELGLESAFKHFCSAESQALFVCLYEVFILSTSPFGGEISMVFKKEKKL